MTQESQRISIAKLLEKQGEAMHLHLIAGRAGLERYIERPRLQKPSFALAGFLEGINPHLLQVIGQTGLAYLATFGPDEQKRAIDGLFDLGLACVIITLGLQPPDVIVEAAERTATPLLGTDMETSDFMTDMQHFLAHELAPRTYQHGVYMDIYGLGVLITGASGIGKSEIALELITRGHRLIADDMVELMREGPNILVGRSPEALRYHMEIRGLGILNIRDLFGAASLTDTKRVGLVVEVVAWEKLSPEDRILSEEHLITLHGADVAKTTIPIRPGRSLAVLVEVAARNHLLKTRGIDSSKAFVQALETRIQQGQKPS